ncbi:hypothetical protein EDB89DRAFT_856787 [Lactarius sanguifluus]|nr:hypothetical protein EDB89DRAFT_856787 [Lactarius sanguifluus]
MVSFCSRSQLKISYSRNSFPPSRETRSRDCCNVPIRNSVPPLAAVSATYCGRASPVAPVSQPDAQYRLLTCLDAIYRGLKAFNVAPLDQSGKSVLDSIRINFAELGMMRVLWSDQGTAIRVSARCICALLARRILRDIGGPGPRRTPGDGELSWLAAVFDESSVECDFQFLRQPRRGGLHEPRIVCGRGVRDALGTWGNKQGNYIYSRYPRHSDGGRYRLAHKWFGGSSPGIDTKGRDRWRSPTC